MRAQQDPTDLLRLTRAKIANSLDRLPKYMCTQTVDRSLYGADLRDGSNVCDEALRERNTHVTSSDRLRLDVAMASAMEMYSWVGESRFSDRDLLDMVHEGAISTGSFASFLTGIFRTDDVNFTYNGEKQENGREVAEFGFRIPYEMSNYIYGNGQYRVRTAWDGTFLVDAQSGDLVRLNVRTSRLPPQTGACYASTALDYGRVRIKDSDFLLPTAAHLRILKTDGGEADNRTVFSNCHEFLGESRLSFDSPPSAALTAASDTRASQAASLPPGLYFKIALTQGIDTATAAGGDPVRAKLITPIQNRSKVLVPAGTPVLGRIVRLREYYGSQSAIALDIKLEKIDVGGGPVRLSALPEAGGRFQQTKSGTMHRRVEIGTLRGIEERAASFVFRDVTQPYLIGSGLESGWVTARPEADAVSAAPN